MLIATIGQLWSSCRSTSRPFASVCLVNGMFTRSSDVPSPDDRERYGGTVVAGDRHLRRRPFRRRDEGAGGGRLGLADEERHAVVSSLANRLVPRHAAEERNLNPGRPVLAPAATKNGRFPVAIAANEITHCPHRADRPGV